MKKKQFGALLALTLAGVMSLGVACNGGPTVPDDDEQPPVVTPTEKPYTVTFKNGDTVVKTVKADTGDTVDIPDDLVSEDARYTFVGWEGLDAADKAAGKVEVFSENLTYNAIWYEQFGSDTTYTAMQVRTVADIAVDGEADAAYDDAQAIALDEDGSYVKFMWTETNIYVFVNVVDDNVKTTVDDPAEEKDGVELKIDLLHSEELASDWNGTDWGGNYRGEYMVEGGYKIYAGSQEIDNAYWEWLSNSDSDREAKSALTETGYTVEFRIGMTNGNIGNDHKPHVDQEIGLGLRTIKTTDAGVKYGALSMESFNGYMDHGPKSLSNIKLVANPNNTKAVWNVKEVRENYAVQNDGERDLLYKDASVFTFGEGDAASKLEMLWGANGVYVFATLGAEAETLALEAFGQTLTIETSGEYVLTGRYALNDYDDLTLTVGTGEAQEYIVKMVQNENNFGRHMYEAKQLADGATITVDGVKDAAYGEAVAQIDTVSLTENGRTPSSTGVAYIRWDDEYLYVFVEVTDADVSREQIGEPHNNDSVEVWLSTCQSLPQASTGWGDANRPLGAYRGEGGYRVVANKVGGDTGMHWLWDDERTRPETASVLTDTGYTVEYKIPWGKKLDGENAWDDGFANYIPATGESVNLYADPDAHTNKIGQIIDIMININDNNGQDGVRNGITSLNGKGCEAWAQPYVLDQLKLVAAE